MPVIHVAPSWQGLSALVRCGVAAGIGPFAQGSLDEALSLAISPGRIGPCADMFQARVTASSGKGFRDIAAAITGHDTGHFHTGPLVPGDGGPEGNNSTERFFIGMDLAEGEARMVVNADMHIFPAIAANRPASRARPARALASPAQAAQRDDAPEQPAPASLLANGAVLTSDQSALQPHRL